MENITKHPYLFLVTGIAILALAAWLFSSSFKVTVEKAVNFAIGGESNLDQLGVNYLEVNANVATSTNPRYYQSCFTDKIASGEQHGFFKSPFNNGTRGNIFVDPDSAWFTLVGDSNGVLNASSSFLFDIATATNGSLAPDAQTVKGGSLGAYSSSTIDVLPFGSIIDSATIGTSTATSTTGSFLKYTRTSDSRSDDYNDINNALAKVVWDEYIVGVLTEHGDYEQNIFCRPNDDGITSNNLCEPATSTARGFDIEWGACFFSSTTPPVEN